jgi:hypothetical protein
MGGNPLELGEAGGRGGSRVSSCSVRHTRATPLVFCGMDAGKARTEGHASLRWRGTRRTTAKGRGDAHPRPGHATGEEGEQRRSVRDEQDGGVRLRCERVNENPGHLREYERASERGRSARESTFRPRAFLLCTLSIPPLLHPLLRLHPRQGTAKQGGWAGSLLGGEHTQPHRPLRGSVLDSLVLVRSRLPAWTHSSTSQAPRPRLA